MLEWSNSGIPGIDGELAVWDDFLLCVQRVDPDLEPCYYFVIDTVSDDRLLTGEAESLAEARALCARFCLLIQNVSEKQKAKIIKLSQFYS